MPKIDGDEGFADSVCALCGVGGRRRSEEVRARVRVDERGVQILVVVASTLMRIPRAGEDEGSCVFCVDEVSREPKVVVEDKRKESALVFARVRECRRRVFLPVVICTRRWSLLLHSSYWLWIVVRGRR